MLSYDKEKQLLCIGKVPYAKESYEYQETDMHKSYMKYVTEGVIEDIKDLVDRLGEALVKTSESSIHLDSYEIVLDKHASFKGYEYYSVRVTFGGLGLADLMQPFVIFKIPYMDDFGVVYREGKTYALISELVQDDDITYGDNELKVITKGGNYINIKPTGSGSGKMTTKFRQKNLRTADILFGLAEAECLNGADMYRKLKSVETASLFKSDEELEVASWTWDTTDIKQFVECIGSDSYDVSVVRDRLNEVFSLNKALGEVLFEDVELKDGTVLEYGTRITENVLRKLKQSYINEVYVKYIPNMIGQITAENIILPIIRKGTEMLECIEVFLPEEEGMFVSRDYFFEDGHIPVIPKETMVSEGFLEMLAFNGYTSVKLKQSETTSSVTEVPLEVSIIGNRHFKRREIGAGMTDEYVYVSEDGTIQPASSKFTAYDMLAMMSLFDRLQKGLDIDLVADRDMGLRKKVHQANELFHKSFSDITNEYVRLIRNKFITTYKSKKTSFASPDEMESMFFKLSEMWWRRLYNMKVINTIDKLNPIAYYSSFNKINTIVSDKNAIKRSQHGLSMGHFNRICPYETPSGKTMGIVGNKVPECVIVDSKMLTPYFRILHVGGEAFVGSEKEYLDVRTEERYRIGSITALDVDWTTRRILTKGRVMARVPARNSLEKMTVVDVDISYLDYVNCDPQQTMSLTAQTIPFAGGDDSARVIFGLSMAKQAKGLVDGEEPWITTSAFYDVLQMSDFYAIHAEKDGVVVEVTDTFVAMLYDDDKVDGEDDFNHVRLYEFKQRDITVNALIIRSVNVAANQRVKAGDILVRSNYIKGTSMVTGRNALVGYVSVGYNYEDGVFMSQRFCYDTMSFGCFRDRKKIPKVFRSAIPSGVNKYKYLKQYDKLYTLTYSNKQDEENKYTEYSEHARGFVIRCAPEATKDMKATQIVTETVTLDYSEQGDKFANRHGNKGVTPRITKNSDMPAFNNGEFLDLAYNPEGVPSRMNLGQVLECHIGLVAFITGIRVRCDSFNGADIHEIKLLLSLVWNLANTDDWDSVLGEDRFSSLPNEYVRRLYQNKERVRNWEDSFNEDGTAWLINPKTDTYYETPVLIGVNYVYKLYHEVRKKEHARAGYMTEPYVAKLSSPPKGSSKSGGQRMGYMELDALMQYGAVDILHEFENERGDNAVARSNLTADELLGGDLYKMDESVGLRRSTEYFVAIMQALGVTIDFEGDLPNKTREEYSKRLYYSPKALQNADCTQAENSNGAVNKSFASAKSEVEELADYDHYEE